MRTNSFHRIEERAMIVDTAPNQVNFASQKSPFPQIRMGAIASFGLLLVTICLWQTIPRLIGVPSFIFPTFTDTLWEGLFLIRNERLLYHALMTSMNVLIGFALGSVFGMLLGYFLGLCRTAE